MLCRSTYFSCLIDCCLVGTLFTHSLWSLPRGMRTVDVEHHRFSKISGWPDYLTIAWCEKELAVLRGEPRDNLFKS